MGPVHGASFGSTSEWYNSTARQECHRQQLFLGGCWSEELGLRMGKYATANPRSAHDFEFSGESVTRKLFELQRKMKELRRSEDFEHLFPFAIATSVYPSMSVPLIFQRRFGQTTVLPVRSYWDTVSASSLFGLRARSNDERTSGYSFSRYKRPVHPFQAQLFRLANTIC